MTNTKITKRMRFEEIIEIGEKISNSGIVDFAKHEIALLDKKASAKTTKVNTENEVLKSLIVQELDKIGAPVTITELQASCKELSREKYSNQKISALLTQLKVQGLVENINDKKESTFTVVH